MSTRVHIYVAASMIVTKHKHEYILLQMLVVTRCVLRSSPRARRRRHRRQLRRIRSRNVATAWRGAQEVDPVSPHKHGGPPPAGSQHHGPSRTDVGLRVLRSRGSECCIQLPVCRMQLSAGALHLHILLCHTTGREASVEGCIQVQR